ncbi:MAG TPA: glycosyltransferase [Flavobacteriales bacterium]|nr:hypothetical protein [Flavobacterium sp.]HRE73170.1 glycosyltransferase [Flavobacteriales bacterium]
MITFYYQPNANWIAESYYYLNTIRTLSYLRDDERPAVLVYCPDESAFVEFSKIKYPELKLVSRKQVFSQGFFDRVLNKLRIKVFTPGFRNLGGTIGYFSYGVLDSIRPLVQNLDKVIVWIPDLQELVLPEFFSSEEIERRKEIHQKIILQGNEIVFSSDSARKDFINAYPGAQNKMHIYHFSSILPEHNHVSFSAIKAKYSVHESYYFAPNQFWAHKNQLVILKALLLLREQGLYPKVVFTGKQVDLRNPGYSNEIHSFISENNLNDQVKILGFIDRIDQLVLMKASLAVIQPSLFEGWSTVVEDCKAMGKSIIVSDINVHREQDHPAARYFSPKDPKQLADAITADISSQIEFPVSYLYDNQIVKSANEILSIFKA